MPDILEGLSRRHTLWLFLLAGEGRAGVAVTGGWGSQRAGAPSVFPLTKMSKTAAEEVSVAGTQAN